MKRTPKVAKVKSDERMVINFGEDENGEERKKYLTPRMKWSSWKVDGKVFYSENDATSALIIKRIRWDDIIEEPEPQDVVGEVQSWSELW